MPHWKHKGLGCHQAQGTERLPQRSQGPSHCRSHVPRDPEAWPIITERGS